MKKTIKQVRVEEKTATALYIQHLDTFHTLTTEEARQAWRAEEVRLNAAIEASILEIRAIRAARS